jgi:hypothetical protein
LVVEKKLSETTQLEKTDMSRKKSPIPSKFVGFRMPEVLITALKAQATANDSDFTKTCNSILAAFVGVDVKKAPELVAVVAETAAEVLTEA